MIVFLSVIISFNPKTVDRIVLHTIDQAKEKSSFLSYRHTLHLKIAYEMFLDKKFLGHGLKSFRHLCSSEKYKSSVAKKIKKDSDNIKKENKFSKNPSYLNSYNSGCNTHPHNIYFEFLAEIGLIGFAFFFILFIYITCQLIINFYKLVIRKNNHKYIYAKAFILFGIFSSMMPMVPSGSYFNNWLLLTSYFPLGFYFFILNEAND